jgi:hypothetical protein
MCYLGLSILYFAFKNTFQSRLADGNHKIRRRKMVVAAKKTFSGEEKWKILKKI